MEQSSAMRQWNHLICETDAAYHEAARTLGLTDSSMMILYMLYVNNGSSLLSEIYTQSGISKQTINSALRKLEAEQLVRTEQYSGKKKIVLFTENGKAYAHRTIAHIIAIENEILDSFTAEELKTLLALSQKYLIKFKEKAKTLPERMDHENSTF